MTSTKTFYCRITRRQSLFALVLVRKYKRNILYIILKWCIQQEKATSKNRVKIKDVLANTLHMAALSDEMKISQQCYVWAVEWVREKFNKTSILSMHLHEKLIRCENRSEIFQPSHCACISFFLSISSIHLDVLSHKRHQLCHHIHIHIEFRFNLEFWKTNALAIWCI